MKNQAYDILKWVALVLLPSVIVLLNQLDEMFHWSSMPLLIKCVQIFAVFLGSLIQLSNYYYHKDEPGNKDASYYVEGVKA